MKQLVFIVSKLSQPRIIKRINTIKESGINFKVYGFDDGLYENNSSSINFKIEERLINNETSYIRRRLFQKQQIKRIYKSNSDSIFYVFGYDCANSLYKAGCRQYIYEEADLNAAKKSYYIQRFLAINNDKRIVNKSIFTVFTSQGFIDYLFKGECKPNYVLLPNKLSPYFYEKDRLSIKTRPININHLRFGFIGLVRYPRTINNFARVIAEHYPNHEFHFFGDISAACKLEVESLSRFNNVYVHGTFSNPSDLQSIYEQIDINIACYDAKSCKTKINVKIAEPNKLYESIYFVTPIIVSKDTYIGNKVKKLEIGEAIDATEASEIKDFIDSLTLDKLTEYKNNERKISTSDLIDDSTELIKKLKSVLSED